jgi:hypothetical protein
VFLLDEGIVFLFACVYFAVTKDLVSGVLFLYWFDLSLVHVIVNDDLFLLEIDRHLGDLLFSRYLLIAFPLLVHFEYLHLPYVVIIVKIVFGCVDGFGFIFDEGDTSTDYSIISVLVVLCCFLSNLLDSLQEAVVVAVGEVTEYAHAAVDLDYLFPMGQFAWAVELDCFEFVGVAVLSL